MSVQSLRKLLADVRDGKLTPDDAVLRLRDLPFEDLGFAKVDHHRALRNGMAEVIFGKGKTPEQVAAIFEYLAEHGNNVLATRATEEQYAAVLQKVPQAEYRETPHAIILRQDCKIRGKGKIVVVSAGTSDIPVAEEAVITAEMMGNDVQQVYDVGVAGIHRLLAKTEMLMQAGVIITVAGMEGALASVVGGLVDVPVVAVPTSVGYGASFGGVSENLGYLLIFIRPKLDAIITTD
jgi:NCAIR mutase (PurE)-related protein